MVFSLYFFIRIVQIFLLLQYTASYYELIEELGCYDSDFRLACETLDQQIIILEATFSDDDSYLSPLKTSCSNPGRLSNRTVTGLKFNFRHAVNKRCSGKNICSFVLLEDYLEARDWGPGSVYLRYACTDGTHVLKTCSSAITIDGEGFVQTPGYPKYYIGGRTCRWTLRAPPYKQVQLHFLDVALRGVGPQERGCRDWLLVTEHGLDILATCGDLAEPDVIISNGSELNITLTTSSKNLFPKRGLLFHYKAVGCVSPKTPKDAYVVSKNESSIFLRCSLGYVFPDSSDRERVINCYDYEEHILLPDCMYIGTDNTSSQLSTAIRMNLTEIAGKTVNDGSSSDLILPGVIIGLMFVINAFIVAAVYFYKKRLLSRGPDPWEIHDEPDFKTTMT